MSIFGVFPRLNNNKLYKLSFDAGKCIKQRHVYINYTCHRFYSQKLNHLNSLSTFVSFNEIVAARRLQASRSILIQVQSVQSYKEVYSYCSTIGTIKQAFHYSIGVEPLHFIIVEFLKEADVTNILLKSAHVNDTHVVPVHSLFMWLKAPEKKSSKQKVPKAAKLELQNGTDVPSENDIRDMLRQEENISEQMLLLYKITKLNDIGIRLRFLVARQIEIALSGIFPHIVAYPFGSSVNGFGKRKCDLDLVLKLYEHHPPTEDSRLVFHCKAVTGSERSTSQRYMETIGDLLQLFLPGCSQVRRILQARVPIIKYYQQLADVECDLSMLNMSGVYMSDLLYIMGEFDSRVRPLVFTIRKWASEVGLTSFYPGRWITNFSLILMVLAFLQKPTHGHPILPGLNFLVKTAGPEDTYIAEDGINCTFLRNPTKLNFKSLNNDNLQSLLEQFFEHYSQFDFSMKAICLNDGSPVTKPDHSPLYIVNPLDRGLNVSKNVSLEELEKLKMEMRNAAWILESQGVKTSNWGILSLFETRKKNAILPPKQRKLIDVSELFEEQSNELQVKKQTIGIKSNTRENTKEIELNLKQRNSKR